MNIIINCYKLNNFVLKNPRAYPEIQDRGATGVTTFNIAG